MQYTSTLLSPNIDIGKTRLRFNDSDENAMGYLIEPLRAELLDRTGSLIESGDRWGWFDVCRFPEKEHPLFQVIERLDRKDPAMLDTGLYNGIGIHLQLGWLDFEKVFTLCRHLLKPGGHLVFTTFGPDTLHQLGDAWPAEDDCAHIHSFPDLHLLGDELIKGGFEKPILDTDWQGVEYEDISLLLSDLRAQCFQNFHKDRRRTLTGKNRWREFVAHFSGQKTVQMTYEIIYGYARVPTQRSSGIRVTQPSRA